MAQCRTQIASITPNLAGALALRKMLIEEFGNDGFVNVAGRKMSLMKPLRKVSNAADVGSKRRNGVVAVSQILLVRVKVRRERALGKPVCPCASK